MMYIKANIVSDDWVDHRLHLYIKTFQILASLVMRAALLLPCATSLTLSDVMYTLVYTTRFHYLH